MCPMPPCCNLSYPVTPRNFFEPRTESCSSVCSALPGILGAFVSRDVTLSCPLYVTGRPVRGLKCIKKEEKLVLAVSTSRAGYWLRQYTARSTQLALQVPSVSSCMANWPYIRNALTVTITLYGTTKPKARCSRCNVQLYGAFERLYPDGSPH